MEMASLIGAFVLLRTKLCYADLVSESRHIWHIYILFFTFLVGCEGMLSFTLGRIVDITVQTTFNYRTFTEVPIYGDLAPHDMWDYPTVEDLRDPVCVHLCIAGV